MRYTDRMLPSEIALSRADTQRAEGKRANLTHDCASFWKSTVYASDKTAAYAAETARLRRPAEPPRLTLEDRDRFQRITLPSRRTNGKRKVGSSATVLRDIATQTRGRLQKRDVVVHRRDRAIKAGRIAPRIIKRRAQS